MSRWSHPAWVVRVLSIQEARPVDVKGLIHIPSLGPVEGQMVTTWSLRSFSGGSNPGGEAGRDPCLYGQPAWGGGWAAWQVQLRGGDHTDLGWGAPDIRAIKAPRSCELHLGYKSVLQTWSQVSVST